MRQPKQNRHERIGSGRNTKLKTSSDTAAVGVQDGCQDQSSAIKSEWHKDKQGKTYHQKRNSEPKVIARADLVCSICVSGDEVRDGENEEDYRGTIH